MNGDHDMAGEDVRQRLYTRLREDLGGEAEADDLLPVMMTLQEAGPDVSAQVSQRLMSRLQQEMAIDARVSWQWMLLILRSQVRVVQREIWIASAVVLLLGTLVTLGTESAVGEYNLLAVAAPVVAAAGIALLYDDDMRHMLEIEAVTPVPPRLLLLARLLLVFGFDLVLALLGSLVLAVMQAETTLGPLVLSWLAPMTFLSALAFFLSVVSKEVILGELVSLGLWGLHVSLYSLDSHDEWLALLALPGLGDAAMRPALWLGAFAVGGLGLWLAGREDRLTGGAV